MSEIGTAKQGMTAASTTGQLIEEQSTAVDELKNDVEALVSKAEGLRGEVITGVGWLRNISEYFTKLAGIQELHDLSADKELAIVESTDECAEQAASVDAVIETFIGAASALIEMLDSSNEIIGGAKTKADELATQIANLVSGA